MMGWRGARSVCHPLGASRHRQSCTPPTPTWVTVTDIFCRWLIQECDAPTPEEALLFVHIPRSGGTSLNDDFHVPQQAKCGRHCFHRMLLSYFFYRYRLLEKSNFPFRSYENAYVLCSISIALFFVLCFYVKVRLTDPDGHLTPWTHPIHCERVGLCLMPWFMMGSGTMTFCVSTFVATAPSLRSDFLRRFYLWFWHVTGAYSTSVITGTNKHGAAWPLMEHCICPARRVLDCACWRCLNTTCTLHGPPHVLCIYPVQAS